MKAKKSPGKRDNEPRIVNPPAEKSTPALTESTGAVLPATGQPVAGNKPARKSIERLMKEDQLEEALTGFEQFLEHCDDITSTLTHTQARLAAVDNLKQIKAIGSSEADTERNKIRFDFQAQLAEFREKVLARFFDLHGEAEFLGKITSRDQVIHEILDMHLLPKRYKRDEKWQKVEGNSSIIYRLFNTDTLRHAIAMVIKMPEIDPALRAEIGRLTDLRHRNIIKLLDHGLNSFPYFVITEYVYGENLPDALSIVGPRPVAQAADWLYQLTDALDYLRHKRILHANVRPSKIYIDDEWQIMISPFDLIKAPGLTGKPQNPAQESELPKDYPGERTFNRYRDVCQYGSPELFERDGECFNDPHNMCISDMYSLGLIGYKILTGEDLFEGERLYDILENRRRFDRDEAYRLDKLAKLPNDTLSGIIRNLLQKERTDRTKHYKNLRELVHALNPLTMAESYEATEVRKSYRRCLAGSREFIHDFYDSFLKKSPHSGDFDDLKRKRQSAMLQMAVDVLLDLEHREAHLIKMIKPESKHARYQSEDFEQFLDNLIETVQKHDPYWDESIRAGWQKVRDEAMAVIRKNRLN